jgi:N-acetylglucosaminyldiphosphoundecaprenol N-acetyl-beta-D-mannosaminyltransferase
VRTCESSAGGGWPMASLTAVASIGEQQATATQGLLRFDVLGVGVHAITMGDALRVVEHAVQTREKGYICLMGVHGIMEAQNDPALRRIFNESMLTTPDGMPTVWVGRWYGHSNMSRTYGPDLMLDVCRISEEKGYKHFLYGGNPGVAQELRDALVARFPKLNIVGTYTPPFRPLNAKERADLKQRVAACKPDVLWVGLSTPKQERFMAEFLQELDVTVMCGVGAAFDIHTGRVKDAPQWMKRTGLQWCHRMLQEPRRLGRRYLVNNPRFILRIMAHILRSRNSQDRYGVPDARGR